MDIYPDRDFKVALCLQSSMLAKETIVKEYGIGEDLTFTVYGWKGDGLRLVASMDPACMKEEVRSKAKRLAVASTVFRQAWGVDEFVLMAEGYVSTDATVSSGRPLEDVFVEQNSPVMECLTFTFVTPYEFEVFTLPYTVGLGRSVSWHKMMRCDNEASLRDPLYPKVLQLALRLDKEPIPDDYETFFDILGTGLKSDGFSVQWKFS